MEDSSWSPGAARSRLLLSRTIFLISLHILQLGSDVFLPRISPSQVALAVALAGVSCLLALAGYAFSLFFFSSRESAC